MIIDYLPFLQLLLSAGLAAMACWIFFDLGGTGERRWVPPLALCGLLALVLGIHLTLTWPLPGALNGIYGGLGMGMGGLLLALAFVLAVGLGLMPLALIAFIMGIAGLVTGVQVLNLANGTAAHLLAAGLISSGAVGVVALPALALHRAPIFRILCPTGLLVPVVIWGVIAMIGFWEHPVKYRHHSPLGAPAAQATPAASPTR